MKPKFKLLRILLLLFLLPIAVLNAEANKWPVISPTRQVFELRDSGSKSLTYKILSKDGLNVYLFEAYLNAYEWDSPPADFILSGDFECVFTPLYGKASSINLLTYSKNQTKSIENRGRFLLGEFENQAHPAPVGWGKERGFRLRGMELVIRILDFKLSTKDNTPGWAERGKSRLEWLKFEIEAKPFPGAQNSIQEFKDYVAPN